jgi:hypothetical protein
MNCFFRKSRRLILFAGWPLKKYNAMEREIVPYEGRLSSAHDVVSYNKYYWPDDSSLVYCVIDPAPGKELRDSLSEVRTLDSVTEAAYYL